MRKIIFIATLFVVAALLVGCGKSSSKKGKKFYKAMKSQMMDQKACSGENPKAKSDGNFVKGQQKLVKYPAGNKVVGDAKMGAKWFGNKKIGNCYACHCVETSANPKKACGTVGPNLAKYATKYKHRKAKYVYDRIFNNWAHTPCSVMPRYGVHKRLKPGQVADIVAFLMDKGSAVNK